MRQCPNIEPNWSRNEQLQRPNTEKRPNKIAFPVALLMCFLFSSFLCSEVKKERTRVQMPGDKISSGSPIPHRLTSRTSGSFTFDKYKHVGDLWWTFFYFFSKKINKRINCKTRQHFHSKLSRTAIKVETMALRWAVRWVRRAGLVDNLPHWPVTVVHPDGR